MRYGIASADGRPACPGAFTGNGHLASDTYAGTARGQEPAAPGTGWHGVSGGNKIDTS